MNESNADILLVREPMSPTDVARLVALHFEDMVKYVVDVDLGIAAVGGERYADAEQVLIEAGSKQTNLWGANYDPVRPERECIEYTSLINIRSVAGNRSMEIEARNQS